MRDGDSPTSRSQEPSSTPYPPTPPPPRLPLPVRLDVGAEGGDGVIRATVPAGWGDRAALSILRPAILRAVAPPMPPPPWCAAIVEALAEREAIAGESGAADAAAVALADVRVQLWRGDIPCGGGCVCTAPPALAG